MKLMTTRRQFLRQTSAAAGVTSALSALGGVHAFAAQREESIELGLIGCGGQMAAQARNGVLSRPGSSIAWLCDVDAGQIDRVSEHIARFQSTAPRRTARFEDVINDRSVDAVYIATPHHWHVPIALMAMEAGKDVYVEKVMSHVYTEGKRVIQAAHKHGRIVQHGTQMRSSPVTEKAGRLLAEGIIGEVKVARAWTAELRQVQPPVPDGSPPAGVDYDRWLGPAPARPFNRHRFHQSWRLFRDYGNGEIGDDGIHDLDMACWGLGVAGLPRQVTVRGGTMHLHGHDSEFPDNMTVAFDYPDGKLLIYENLPFTSYGLHGFDNGNVFYGTEGYMVFSRRGAFSVFLGPKSKRGPTEGKEIRGSYGYAEHMDDFLQAVRTRKPPRASADVAHRSCALVHLGDIAHHMGGRLEFDPESEKFVDCDAANRLLSKEYRAPYGLPESAV